jgi:molybdate transport system substrate-binding protein
MRDLNMKLQKVFLLTLINAILFTGCSPAMATMQALATSLPEPTVAPTAESPEGKLTILAAASLTESFTEIGTLFEEQNPKVTVEFSFGGSQQLAQQIQQSAPADVFASASKKYMDAVIETGQVTADTQTVFVENKLVVIVPSSNPAHLETLMDLTKSRIKLVLAAKEVPVGQYSLEFLTKAMADPTFGADYEMKVLNNVVSYEDNVKSVLAKVVLGEADAGIVYSSDVTGDAIDQVKTIEIPDELNTIAKYPIAAINTSKEPELAASFIQFVLSPEGQGVLAKYGFLPVAGR